MSIFKVFIWLIILLAIGGSVYWFAYKPEQIRIDCNEQALVQAGLPLTYFRRNSEGLNDNVVDYYEQCLKASQYYSYSWDMVFARARLTVEDILSK